MLDDTITDEMELRWMADQDRAHMNWHLDHAEEEGEEDYQAWASDRREDGEDDSQEAYDEYIEWREPEEYLSW